MRKSPRQIECCAVVGPQSQGETASPSNLLIWPCGKSNGNNQAGACFGGLACFADRRSRAAIARRDSLEAFAGGQKTPAAPPGPRPRASQNSIESAPPAASQKVRCGECVQNPRCRPP